MSTSKKPRKQPTPVDQPDPSNSPSVASLDSALAMFAPGEGDTVDLPLLDGSLMKFRRFRRYADLDTFKKQRDKWAAMAVKGGIPELRGVPGITRGEALQFYTIHACAVDPPVPIEAYEKLCQNPFFIEYVVGWLQNTLFSSLEEAFVSEMEEGKG